MQLLVITKINKNIRKLWINNNKWIEDEWGKYLI